jgi:glycosyltransferase involved in cell wall biosynthesis
MPEIAELRAPKQTAIRVLAVSHYFVSNGYGIERIAERLNEQLRAQGYRVRWLASTVENSVARSLPSGVDDVGIPSWDGIREATDLGWPLFAPWWLPRIFREVWRADIVHLHEAFFPLHQVVLWIAVLLRRPIVITQHIADMPIRGLVRGNLVRLANLLMTRPAYAFADCIVYYSRRTQAQLGHLSRGKEAFVWNGCDSELFHPVLQDQVGALRRELELRVDGVLTLFVGRFIEKKGLHLLRALAATHPDVAFVFVGSGPLDPRSWGLRNVVVRSAVPQPSLRMYYQASDVLVLPAVGEGFPLVVQEACCCGLPVLVSREVLDACPELAPFAYDAGEGGRRLSAAFADFLARPEARDRMRERAAFSQRLWSWARCGEAYAEILRSLVVNRQPGKGRDLDARVVEEGR